MLVVSNEREGSRRIRAKRGETGRRGESEKDKKYHTEANYLSISA